MKKPRTLRVMVYEPGKPGELREVTDELASYKKLVNGYIETTRLHAGEPSLLMVCNEDGLRMKLPHNRGGLVGTFFVVRQDRAEFVSLTESDERVVRTLLDR